MEALYQFGLCGFSGQMGPVRASLVWGLEVWGGS